MLNLTGQFLIALQNHHDNQFESSLFDGSLIYVCQHDGSGAFGIVINQPSEMNFSHLLEKVNIDAPDHLFDMPVFQGGPVQTERGFVLHPTSKPYDSTLKVNDDISLTTSCDILQAFSRGEGPNQILISLGYAGWGGGQLEEELAKNWWLTAPANLDLLFNQPVHQRHSAALSLLGISLETLSMAGRA